MTTNINFKRSVTQYNNFDNKVKFKQAMLTDADLGDMFAIQEKQNRKAEKKERNREIWNRVGVGANVGLAGAMIAIAYTMLRGGVKKEAFVKFKKLAKDSLPALESDSVNPKARDFIKMVKERTALSEDLAKKAGSEAPEQCVLFYGPSGTGKTFSAKIMANELGAEYAEVDFPKIASPYVGQASKNIDQVFKSVREQAQKEPNKNFLVAFNEIDSMLIPMERSGNNQSYVLENRTAFLNGLDSVSKYKNIKIVGTTNANPDSGNLDLAALSRFGNIFEVELPTTKEIIASLKWHLKNCESVEKDKFFEKNSSAIDKFAKDLYERNFSQRDVEKIAQTAKTNYSIVLGKSNNAANEKFELKYLEDALKNKEFVTGGVGKKGNHNINPGVNNNEKISFWKWLGLYFLRK